MHASMTWTLDLMSVAAMMRVLDISCTYNLYFAAVQYADQMQGILSWCTKYEPNIARAITALQIFLTRHRQKIAQA